MQTVIDFPRKGFISFICILSSLLIAYLTVNSSILTPILSLIFGVILIYLILVFRSPFMGLMSLIIYCFIYFLFTREIGEDFPFGYLVEVLYVIIAIAVIVNSSRSDWRRINSDLCILFLIWFLISVLEILNPGSSARGWVTEIRSSALDSFVLVPMGFMLFRNVNHLNIFLYIIIGISFLATLNGFKQIYIGLFPGERDFLINSPTHMIWGKMRVFSFYSDAGQFGASQAQLCIICGVLALGPFRLWKRILLSILTFAFFYGMLISGTRGALFALIPGIFLAIFLFKNLKILLGGAIFLLFFITVLKFTNIGSSNYHIFRIRTALNAEDPSLNVRFTSQQVLKKYLKNYPFGGGLGVIGYAGHKFNSDKFLSTIEPDSYWVKVWAMYGIVGMTIWFSMMMFILGKCCGLVWKIQNKKLRVKLIALTSGFFGIFICSYGNEIINAHPSSIIVYLSLVFIFLGPELDLHLSNNMKI